MVKFVHLSNFREKVLLGFCYALKSSIYLLQQFGINVWRIITGSRG